MIGKKLCGMMLITNKERNNVATTVEIVTNLRLIWGVGLNRTSLAAFIIAMGMLVDNAIVVTDNAQVGIKRGLSRYQALIDGATKPQWALLGATFIAVCSFLPMYLAPARDPITIKIITITINNDSIKFKIKPLFASSAILFSG